jgi:pimeloyl-ACP methyl ester carboxylesterase
MGILVGLTLVGCGSSTGKTNPTTAPTQGSTSAPASSGPAPTTAPTTAPSVAPSPFPTQSSLPLDPRNKNSKVVSFDSADGIKLTGRVFGSGPHGVVLAPSGNDRYSQFEWLALATALSKVGYHVLTFDVRGVCYPPDPNVGCSEGEIDWANAWKDVAGAVAFLRAHGGKTVSVVGADLGATEAFSAAAQGTKMDGIVSISGLNDTEGYEIDTATLDKVGAPILLIAGNGDSDAVDAYKAWLKEAPPSTKGLLLNTDLRGTFVFDPIAPSDFAQAKRAKVAVEEFLQQHD